MLGFAKALFGLGLLGVTSAAATARGPTAQNTWNAMNPGWNLGNTLDAIPDETSWGNPKAVPELIDAIKASGFKSIRIPVTWADHFAAGSPTFTVNATWMARVEEVLDMVLSRDLYAVLNVHHDSWQWADFSAPSETAEAQFVSLWKQIAAMTKDKSHLLILESLNEPVGETQAHAETLNHINQLFVDIVRGSGGKNRDRLLTLPGLNTNIQRTVDWFQEPANAQPYILHVHDYDPWDFVSTSWGRTFWGTDEDKTQIEDTFVALNNRFRAPALIGEWGLTGRSIERSYAWAYFDFIVRTARAYNLTTQLWDNGFDHYDRANYRWRDPVKPQIIVNAAKGIANALPAYDQLSVLYIPAASPAKTDPLTIRLEFNGNTLRDVKNAAGTTLRSGRDYTVSAAGVTVTSAYLATLDLAGAGRKDTLTLRFTKGAALPFDITVYAPPTTSTPSATVTDVSQPLTIPVNAGGSELATVKAVRADGVILKDDWTQWLGPLQQGRINWGDFETVEGGVQIMPSTLELVRQAGVPVVFTLEYWPRGVGNDVNVTVTAV